MSDDLNPNSRPRLPAVDLAMLRVRRFTPHRITPAVHGPRQAVVPRPRTVGGEPVPFAHAVLQTFAPFAVGEMWGRPWDTVWFEVRGEVPAGWTDAELLVDLGFTSELPGFQAEATAYRPDGSVIKAVEPRNAWVPIDAAGPFTIYLEAAANPLIGDALSGGSLGALRERARRVVEAVGSARESRA